MKDYSGGRRERGRGGLGWSPYGQGGTQPDTP